MSDDIKFAVFEKTETFMESFYKDFVTTAMIGFCVYISQGSTWWTFVTGLMFMLFAFGRISVALKRHKRFKTKDELKAWVDSLPDA